MNESSIWILNFNYDNVLDLTYDFFKSYGKKISADVNIIDERLNPDWHITYEKSQVYKKGKNYKWNLVFDTDVLLHPDLPDLTKRVNEYTVGVKDSYNCQNRFNINTNFFRDQRFIGISGVFTMASFYCHDIFTPLEKSQDYYVNEINLDDDDGEKERGVQKEHFITEYWLSNNLAKYGLKYQGILDQGEYYTFYHPYGWYDNTKVFHSFTHQQKIQNIKDTIKYWENLN